MYYYSYCSSGPTWWCNNLLLGDLNRMLHNSSASLYLLYRSYWDFIFVFCVLSSRYKGDICNLYKELFYYPEFLYFTSNVLSEDWMGFQKMPLHQHTNGNTNRWSIDLGLTNSNMFTSVTPSPLMWMPYMCLLSSFIFEEHVCLKIHFCKWHRTT